MALLFLGAGYIAYLGQEAFRLRKDRSRIDHVVHVNGTRGKSTVSRLIEAGLRAGGYRVFCKTTGTDPMTIDVDEREEVIKRRGKANIKEQIKIMHRAAEQGAQVLVVECMAVQPELQRAAQHDILHADIGVITNVRRDHTDVMGHRLSDICDALSNTVPRNGILFTAETVFADQLGQKAKELNSSFQAVRPDGTEETFDFPENIALALAVCSHMGVPKETALSGMRAYHRDPYALTMYRLGEAVFINGLSINDIQSTEMVWEDLCSTYHWQDKELILLVHNREDRGSRTEDMLKVCISLRPSQIWLSGAMQNYMDRGIKKHLPDVKIRHIRTAEEIDVNELKKTQILFAVGNLANGGRELLQRVKEEGKSFV